MRLGSGWFVALLGGRGDIEMWEMFTRGERWV